MEQTRVQAFRQRLQEERESLQERLKEEEELAEIEALESPDNADLAFEYDQHMRRNAMAARTRKQIDEIDGALQRMERGTYGQCANCGKEIHPERLDAIPWTMLCVDCQQQMEK